MTSVAPGEPLTDYVIREYRKSDDEKLRAIREVHGRASNSLLDPERRLLMKIETAGEIGANLSDPSLHYADHNKLTIPCQKQRPETPVAYCAMSR